MLCANKLGSVRIINPALSFTFDIRKAARLNVDIQRVTPDVRLPVDFNQVWNIPTSFIQTHHWFSYWRIACGQTYMQTNTGVVTLHAIVFVCLSVCL
jgi:hypothetical protein